MEEDPDIEILKAKKMQEIMQRMMKQKKKDRAALKTLYWEWKRYNDEVKGY